MGTACFVVGQGSHTPFWEWGRGPWQCSPMAVVSSDISGNDRLRPINSSTAADRMSDEIFRANLVFWLKFELGTRIK